MTSAEHMQNFIATDPRALSAAASLVLTHAASPGDGSLLDNAWAVLAQAVGVPAARQAVTARAERDHPGKGAERAAAAFAALGIDAAPLAAPKPGDLVITKWDDEPVTYGGPSDQPGMTTLKLGVITGGMRGAERLCDPEDVAPAATPIPAADDRARIAKLPRKRYAWDAGPWMVYLPGVPDEQATAHRTKKEAHAQAMRRLAIADHVAARANG